MVPGVVVVAGALVPFGALVGALVWADARSRGWSSRPWYQFVVAGVVILVPVVIVVLKVVAGGFSNAQAWF